MKRQKRVEIEKVPCAGLRVMLNDEHFNDIVQWAEAASRRLSL